MVSVIYRLIRNRIIFFRKDRRPSLPVAVARLAVSRIKNRNKKPAVAFVTTDFHIGGLEQIVLNLYSDFRKNGTPSFIIADKVLRDISDDIESPDHLLLTSVGFAGILNFCAKNNIRILNFHTLFPWKKSVIMRMLGFRLYFTLHNTYMVLDPGRWKQLMGPLRHFYSIIAVSEWAKDYFLRTTLYSGPIVTIENGINLDFCKNAPKREADDSKIFIVPSRISYGKNQMCLIGVMKKVVKKRKDVRILLCAPKRMSERDDVYFGEIKKQIHEARLDKYIAIDSSPEAHGKRFIEHISSVADAILLPSAYESVGICIFEGRALGMPVISADFGFSEYIRTEKNIHLVSRPYGHPICLDEWRIQDFVFRTSAPNEDELVKKILYVADHCERRKKPNKKFLARVSSDRMSKEYLDLFGLSK